MATRDESAFSAVFATHHKQVVRLAYLLTSDADAAEDIASDVFAKVFKRWRKGDIENIAAYLRRAVANEANSKLRRRYLERGHAARRNADDRGVRHLAEAAADQDQVWQALNRLPQGQRSVLVLRFYDQLSEAEIAATLDISTGTVKSQAARGLDRLRTLIGEAQ